jgi:hypothetical protein
MAQFQEQLARVRRFLKRIETHDRSWLDYDDDIWSFFQNCWHLKDWIKNDSAVPESVRTALEDELKNWPDLMVCVDLANATKHLQLNNPRVGAKHSHKNYSIVVGSSSKVEYFIDKGDGSRVDGVTLADACVVAWEGVLAKFGLPLDV